ncbi:MAG: tetratricopeptide repeat protein [Acidobacteriota bacterium]|nr:tetratricopeptide repeat protein [Acidobacteriota bacterium]
MLLLLLAGFQEQPSPMLNPVPAFREDLQALAFPELGKLEPKVQEQITTLREELVAAIAEEPKQANTIRDAYMKLGRTFHAYKRFDLAEICYRNSDILAPGRFETVYLAADLARIQGQDDRMEELYRRAMEILPTYHSTYVRLGDIALTKGNVDEAKMMFEEALKREPIEAAAYFGLGQVAMEQRDFDTAITHFEKALSYVNEANRIHYLLGMAWRNKGDVDKAKHHLKLAGKRGVKPMDSIANNLIHFVESGRVHIARGKAAFGAKDYAGAAKEFAQAASALPNDTSSRVNLGTTLALLGKKQEAVDAFRDALRIDPNNVSANYNIGVLTLEAGRPDLAMPHLQKVVQLDPKDASSRMRLAGILKNMGRLQEAYGHYDMAAKLEPKNEDALIQRAYLLIQAGKNEEAMKVLAEDWELNQNFGRLTHLYARFLAACPVKSLRNGTKAVDLAQRVVNASPEAEYLETLAMAHAQTGDCDKAVEVQTKAVEAAQAVNRQDQVSRMNAELARYRKGAPCESE